MDKQDVTPAVALLMIDTLIRALVKQPAIDVPKLVSDINASLLAKEVAAEGIGHEALVRAVRTGFAGALPELPRG